MWWCSGKRGERLGYKRSESDPELRFSFLLIIIIKKTKQKSLNHGSKFSKCLKKGSDR